MVIESSLHVLRVYVYTNVRTYRHIHTYIPTYIHTDILTYLHTHILAYLLTYLHTFIHTLHYIALQYDTIQYITLQYITIHYNTLHALHTLPTCIHNHTYMHACMHKQIHPSIHPSMHACMHACIHTITYIHLVISKISRIFIEHMFLMFFFETFRTEQPPIFRDFWIEACAHLLGGQAWRCASFISGGAAGCT